MKTSQVSFSAAREHKAELGERVCVCAHTCDLGTFSEQHSTQNGADEGSVLWQVPRLQSRKDPALCMMGKVLRSRDLHRDLKSGKHED